MDQLPRSDVDQMLCVQRQCTASSINKINNAAPNLFTILISQWFNQVKTDINLSVGRRQHVWGLAVCDNVFNALEVHYVYCRQRRSTYLITKVMFLDSLSIYKRTFYGNVCSKMILILSSCLNDQHFALTNKIHLGWVTRLSWMTTTFIKSRHITSRIGYRYIYSCMLSMDEVRGQAHWDVYCVWQKRLNPRQRSFVKRADNNFTRYY